MTGSAFRNRPATPVKCLAATHDAMTGETGTHSVEDLHRVALLRSEALVVLREEPATQSSLQDRLDVSKTTAYRTTNALADHGLAERRNGTYALTAVGEIAAERAEALCLALSATEHVDPLFELIDRAALDLDPALLAESVVTRASSSRPYAPIRRFWSVVSEAEQLGLLYNTVHAPDSMDRYAELVEDGLALTIVYDPATAETNVAAIAEHRPGLLSAGKAELRVGAESFGGGVAMTEARVGVMGHDPEKGTPVVAADTDDPDALAWGESLFDRHYEASEPIEKVTSE